MAPLERRGPRTSASAIARLSRRFQSPRACASSTWSIPFWLRISWADAEQDEPAGRRAFVLEGAFQSGVCLAISPDAGQL